MKCVWTWHEYSTHSTRFINIFITLLSIDGNRNKYKYVKSTSLHNSFNGCTKFSLASSGCVSHRSHLLFINWCHLYHSIYVRHLMMDQMVPKYQYICNEYLYESYCCHIYITAVFECAWRALSSFICNNHIINN